MRLIDADALIKVFNEAQVEFDEYYKGLGRAKVITDNAPTVDAVVSTIEVRPQGKWIGNAFDEHHCSSCGHPALWEEEPDGYYEVQSRFCPNCGACMQEGDAE